MNLNINSILTAVDAGLSVIKKVADLPGVSIIPYVSTLSSAITLIQDLAAAGRDIQPQVQAVIDVYTSDAIPTTDDLAALDASIAAARAELQAPLPPKEEGEPD